MDRMIQTPVSISFLLILLLLLPLLLIMVFINVISVSFVKLGFNPSFAFILLFGSLIGSFINIPIREVESTGDVVMYKPSRYYGWFLPQEVVEKRTVTTVIAANVGGAIIPVMISCYLVLKFPHMIPAFLIGTVVCVAVSYKFATPIPGMGIGMPVFVAPITSALVALALAYLFPGTMRTAIAYTCGVMGVLIGADLLNLDKIKALGAPTASIGGAGTFDGIFLTGILAVLLV
ncbi:MAG: DUF1614 domain-containing protein [Theionarchaea archaeon]|nr:DUF1614 domain-containing protein [Theionarchaea archaeon]